MVRIEILVIGREILTGRTLEADGNWIARQISSMGGRIAQISVIDDDQHEIAARLHEAREHGADLVITTGGLGPTYDDVTAAGIAQALNVPLVLHQSARDFIEDKYLELHRNGMVERGDLTPEREKMAMLPQGAEWIDNPVGVAPGIAVTDNGMEIVALPGVPSELYTMFDLALGLKLARTFGDSGFAELTLATEQHDESVLSPIIEALSAKHQGLHIKSNPTYFGDVEGISVTLSAYAPTQNAAEATVRQAMTEMEAGLAKQQETDE
ncbi:MAG: molybdopterin-binding protein [Candidatus Lernaella stagnicola]|nr:molybdopterin-binding protein [Candidatus Lernaella stagnicola]